MSDPHLEPLTLHRGLGRTFVGRRRVRLGDVDQAGRLRFDALTRYTQDVSDDDTTDAGLAAEPGWVVRSTVVDELCPAELGEPLRFETFCSGLGGRWAERRLSVSGEHGARYEVATLWVCIDAESGRPHRLTDQFVQLYGQSAGDRKVSARPANPGPPSSEGRQAPNRWQVRRADLDVYDHVNNAAYWEVVEEWLGPWSMPRRGRIEYRAGISRVGDIDILVDRADGSLSLWWFGDAGSAEAAATARVVEWPGGHPYP